jgi:hypothetical protein
MQQILEKISKIDEIKSIYKVNYEELKQSKNFWKKL